jgi:hypothetical protein
MTSTLPASSRKCCGTRPDEAAAQQRPSGRSHSTRTDRSTITSPTTRSRTQISPGIHGADQHPERNHSPPGRLTEAPVQLSSTASAQASDCRLAGPSAIDRQGAARHRRGEAILSATDRRGCFSGRNSEQDSAVAHPERPRSAYASAGTGRRGSQMLPCGVRAAEALGDACLRPAGVTVRIVDRATPRGHGLSFPRGRHVRIGRRRSPRRARVRRGVRRSGSRSGSRS